MLLAIDIGNSNTVFSLFEGNDILYKFRFITSKNETSETFELFLDLFNRNGFKIEEVKGSIFSSVVPEIDEKYCSLIYNNFKLSPLVVSNKVKTNLKILIDNPDELGSDRIVNGVAASNLYKRSAIIVDFGTATTFDCISKKGEYLGGVISPGINLSASVLSEKASKLPDIKMISNPGKVIGKDTVHCMKSGLVYGYASLVDGLVLRIKEEMGTDPIAVATGGFAALICGETVQIDEIDQDLTLKGLKIIYELNS